MTAPLIVIDDDDIDGVPMSPETETATGGHQAVGVTVAILDATPGPGTTSALLQPTPSNSMLDHADVAAGSDSVPPQSIHIQPTPSTSAPSPTPPADTVSPTVRSSPESATPSTSSWGDLLLLARKCRSTIDVPPPVRADHTLHLEEEIDKWVAEAGRAPSASAVPSLSTARSLPSFRPTGTHPPPTFGTQTFPSPPRTEEPATALASGTVPPSTGVDSSQHGVLHVIPGLAVY